MDELDRLPNFALIKYTGHYALTIDTGMGRPIILQGESLDSVLKELRDYLERIGRK